MRLHIPKTVLPILVAGLLLGGLLNHLYGLDGAGDRLPVATPSQITVAAPARLLESGPFGTNVRSSFSVDNLTIHLRASRLYMKNAKTLGFSNALFKKLVARDLEIVVKWDGVVILSLTKAYQEMAADMKAFKIDHPHIRHPSDMVPPDRVLIEKDRRRITLWHGAEKKIWDLSAG